MLYSDPAAAAAPIKQALAAAQTVLLLTHVNPDGDAIGSMLGMYHVLMGLGKQSIPLASSELPSMTLGLPGAEQIQVYRPGQPLPASDLIIMLDTATLARVGKVYEHHTAELLSRPLVVIDHHVTNEGGAALNLVQPQAASTCELLYELFTAMGAPITPDCATCLLLGLITDTQSYQTGSTRPESLRAGAALMAAGARHTQVIRDIYFATPYSTVALIGLSLSQIQREDALVWTAITQEMLRRTGAEDEAGDDVVNMMNRIAGIKVSVLFKERADGTVKISLRSRGLDVASIAQRWGGGGHKQAAGANLQMNLPEAETAVLAAVRGVLGS